MAGEYVNATAVSHAEVDEASRIGENAGPTNRLLERQPQDCVRLTDRAARQLSVEQFAIERLDLEASKALPMLSCRVEGAHNGVAALHGLETFCARHRFGKYLGPAIKVLIQRLLERVDIPAAISPAWHLPT
jgi:hypothetical protein